MRLTPAYDICPQSRTGDEASQAMLIQGEGRASRLDLCLAAASQFLLSHQQARDIIERQIDGIHEHWDAVCDEAELTAVDRNLFWQRQILNPYSLASFR